MKTPLTATVSGDGPLSDRHRAVLAGMPDRLRAIDADGDVAMVAAGAGGWTTTLIEMLHRGARGALVVDAGTDDGPEEIAAARRAAREAGAVVHVDRPYAMNRAWQRVSTGWRRDAARAGLLDSTTTVATHSMIHALLNQLALVRAVVGPLEQLGLVHHSRSVYQLAGRAGRVRVSLSGTDGPRDSLTLELIGADTRRRASFAPIGLASPALISTFDQAGGRTEPPLYESGHRAAWQRLHEAITEPRGHPGSDDLDLLAEDVERVSTLFGGPSAG